MSYNKLFEKGKIGKITIKNRCAMMPMGTVYADKDGMATERLVTYYEERARGGIGLIINEYTGVDDIDSIPTIGNLRAARDYNIPALERLTNAVHKYDCKIFAQIHHGGMTSKPALTGHQSLSPSGVPAANGAPVPKEMTIEEIKAVQQKFIDAAVRCQKAGYDGVELHGAHSYLIAQFFSKYYNKRTDEYGGDVENRTRFISEIIDSIRKVVRPDFVVGMRMSGDEMVEGQMTLEDGLEIAKYLEKKLDYINVSNGCAQNGDANCDPYSFVPGWKKHVAKAFKDALSVPVIATNTIKDPDWAEQLIEDGICDFVGLGRSQFADPEFVKKAKEGRADEIVKCIGCMYCRERLMADMPIECSINPMLGVEYIYENIEKNGKSKSVVVIGGGPGGMEAAITLANKNFKVTLVDKNDRLGGTLNVADKAKGKHVITDYVKTMEKLVEKAGVNVVLNTEATPENIKKYNPVGVFIAVGAEPVNPPIKGIDGANVYKPEDVLLDNVKITGKVAVVGTGLTGLEVLEKLGDEGCELTAVEMLSDIGPGVFPPIRKYIIADIMSHNLVSYVAHKLLEIKEKSIVLENISTGETVEAACDSVVVSLGVAPKKGLVESFEKEFDRVIVIGDASKGGRIHNATKDGFTKAYAFEI
ncbi:MAG: FAD-dependent oxidoreductase [Candidatus Metalachnospira sp.]|nr:FAD-dependent oxidoreductase [Candidatus Metalachnospira sp.]